MTGRPCSGPPPEPLVLLCSRLRSSAPLVSCAPRRRGRRRLQQRQQQLRRATDTRAAPSPPSLIDRSHLSPPLNELNDCVAHQIQATVRLIECVDRMTRGDGGERRSTLEGERGTRRGSREECERGNSKRAKRDANMSTERERERERIILSASATTAKAGVTRTLCHAHADHRQIIAY